MPIKQNQIEFKSPSDFFGSLKFYSQREVARRLDLSHTAVYKWIKNNKIFATRIDGGVLIPSWAVEFKRRKGNNEDQLEVYSIKKISSLFVVDSTFKAWESEDIGSLVKELGGGNIIFKRELISQQSLEENTPDEIVTNDDYIVQYKKNSSVAKVFGKVCDKAEISEKEWAKLKKFFQKTPDRAVNKFFFSEGQPELDYYYDTAPYRILESKYYIATHQIESESVDISFKGQASFCRVFEVTREDWFQFEDKFKNNPEEAKADLCYSHNRELNREDRTGIVCFGQLSLDFWIKQYSSYEKLPLDATEPNITSIYIDK